MEMKHKRPVAIAMQPNRIGLLAAALLALAALVAVLMSVKPATAGNGFDPNYRYCVSGVGVGFGGTDIPDCAYNSWDACRFSANGRGYCIENPGYAARPQRHRR
jgi:hypothetical protein